MPLLLSPCNCSQGSRSRSSAFGRTSAAASLRSQDPTYTRSTSSPLNCSNGMIGWPVVPVISRLVTLSPLAAIYRLSVAGGAGFTATPSLSPMVNIIRTFNFGISLVRSSIIALVDPLSLGKLTSGGPPLGRIPEPIVNTVSIPVIWSRSL